MSDLITGISCKNCGEHIASYNFCPNCGAKKVTKRITFKNLLSEFIDRFFNLDNSFIKTFLHLFSKPEEVIDGYINGLRKRYISAFGYFAISLTVSGVSTFFTKDRFNELVANADLSAQQIHAQQTAMDISFQYQSIFNLLLIPLFALLSRLVFINYKKYNLTEHLVIYLYGYSHIVSTTLILSLPFTIIFDNILSVILLQFTTYIFYIAYVLKRLYNISLKKIIIKTLLFIIYGGVFYFVISIVLALSMILIYGIDSFSKDLP